ncbi:MAG: hypothetical protein IJT62_06445 [Oscillospiraceae bacterium]|nr:hypothetical protein [Oscillospiraceae bacterium]
MAMEAIAAVEEAEAAAARLKAETAQEVKQMTAAAEESGRKAVNAALQKAREALREVDRQADERIAADTERIRAETKAAMGELKARAEMRLDDAAKIIVERIVNGA